MAAEEVFEKAIYETLVNWSVLKIAREHGFGGRNAIDKENWLVSSVVHIFKDNDVVYPDELEDFISEAIFNEFDTIVEDGTIGKICQDMCSYYVMCGSNQTDQVIQLITTMKESTSKVVVHKQVDSDDDDDNDVQHTAIQEDNNHTADSIEAASRTAVSNETNGMNIDEQEENDGWEVVKRSKKK